MGRVWDKNKICTQLNKLFKEENINSSYVRENYSSLYSACHNHFGSYKKAVEYSGIDYCKIKLSSTDYKEKFISEIRVVHNSGELKKSFMVTKHRNLYGKIGYYFGTVGNLLEYFEVGYEEYNDTEIKQWTKISIIKELTRLRDDEELTPMYLYKNYPKLISACRYHFGTYEKALCEIGVVYEDIKVQRTWNKENIKKELLKIYNTELVTSTYMIKNHCDLHHACRNHFGTYEKALMAIGVTLKEESAKVSEESVKRSTKWTEEIIRKELMEILESGLLTDGYIRTEKGSLHSACYAYFGGLNEALSSMGIDYNDIIEPNMSNYGFTFERLLGRIYDELGIIYNKRMKNGLRPDFRLDNNIWVDAKLSQWTSTIESTVKKYSGHCNELIIVYLRGYSDETIRKDGIKVISVSKYLRDLGVEKDHIVFEWLDELNKEVG